MEGNPLGPTDDKNVGRVHRKIKPKKTRVFFFLTDILGVGFWTRKNSETEKVKCDDL